LQSYALEVGCGAGNTTFPLLESTDKSNPNLFVYCCDFSPNAVRIVSENEKFNSARCQSFVWDITRSDVEIPIQPSSLDYILAVFVLSALPPEKHVIAIESLARLLKKGGIIYIKDYGRHDLTQLRFKKDKYIRWAICKLIFFFKHLF
jgi:SAM-dependent methyltransferase